MAQPAPVDFVTLVVAASALLFGQPLADMVGPYAGVLLGALAGAAPSTSRRASFETRLQALGHVTSLVIAALMLTVPLAILCEQHLGLKASWTLGPVAVLITGIGHDWPAIVTWGMGLAEARIETFFGPKA